MNTKELKGTSAMRERRRATLEPQMMSFVDMLLMLDSKILKRLKLPPWFPLVYDRKDQATLSEVQRERFLCAYSVLVANGTLGQLVKIHGETHYQHGTQRFLPWHRVFLIKLERALQSIHPEVTIPYWDWTRAAEETFPAWLAGVTPTVPLPPPDAPVVVTRSPGPTSWLASIASNVPSVMGDTDFPTFTAGLEGVHNAVHVWVGGSMSFIPTAPADPIFWMHHANLDRLWWQWQQTHAGENPDLIGTGPSSPVMDPWPTTEPDTRDITAMGYAYS